MSSSFYIATSSCYHALHNVGRACLDRAYFKCGLGTRPRSKLYQNLTRANTTYIPPYASSSSVSPRVLRVLYHFTKLAFKSFRYAPLIYAVCVRLLAENHRGPVTGSSQMWTLVRSESWLLTEVAECLVVRAWKGSPRFSFLRHCPRDQILDLAMLSRNLLL